MDRNFILSASPAFSTPNIDIITGIGLALILAGITASIAAVHFREKNRDRLQKKVSIAKAGLTENAVSSLDELRNEIDLLIPKEDDPFNPDSITLDPTSIVKPAKRSMRLLKEMHGIERYYHHLLVSCSFLKYLIVSFTLFAMASTFLYGFYFGNKVIWVTSAITAGVNAIFLLITYLCYAFLDQRIQQGIEDGIIIDQKVDTGKL